MYSSKVACKQQVPKWALHFVMVLVGFTRPWPSGFQVQEGTSSTWRHTRPHNLLQIKGWTEVTSTEFTTFFPWCGDCDSSGQNEWLSTWIWWPGCTESLRPVLSKKLSWLCKRTETFRNLLSLQHSLAYPDNVIRVVQCRIKIQNPLKKNYSAFQDGDNRALNHAGVLWGQGTCPERGLIFPFLSQSEDGSFW